MPRSRCPASLSASPRQSSFSLRFERRLGAKNPLRFAAPTVCPKTPPAPFFRAQTDKGAFIKNATFFRAHRPSASKRNISPETAQEKNRKRPEQLFAILRSCYSHKFTDRLMAKMKRIINEIFMYGSGAAAGDGDGRCDLYFCRLDVLR
jgi:hypothetical protein